MSDIPFRGSRDIDGEWEQLTREHEQEVKDAALGRALRLLLNGTDPGKDAPVEVLYDDLTYMVNNYPRDRHWKDTFELVQNIRAALNEDGGE